MEIVNSQPKNEVLTQVYQIEPRLSYRVEAGRVIIVKQQKHWVQRLFRKLYVRIPEETLISLDAYGSSVFQAIDGKRTIEELGLLLAEQHPEAATYLYDRLVLYLAHLEVAEKWIQRV